MIHRLGVAAMATTLCAGCEVEQLLDDTEVPAILVTIGNASFSSTDPPPGTEIDCVEWSDGPVNVTVLATDAGGVQQLYIHLIDGFVVEDSVEIQPDEPDISYTITTGDTVLSEGDDELTVELTQPSPTTVRNGVSVSFELQGPTRFALQTLATDYAGNDSITWPVQIHEVGIHGACP
ncbi:MAG: hypothetical protein KTR31_10200 [Myxococcales bacterium]|nr:hypothetical protein [Myxococcales bacterium]